MGQWYCAIADTRHSAPEHEVELERVPLDEVSIESPADALDLLALNDALSAGSADSRASVRSQPSGTIRAPGSE